MRTLAAILVLAAVSAAGSVQAEVTAAERAACTPDAFRLCSSVIPDMGKIIQCLRASKASLSPGCRAAYEAAETRPRPATRSTGSGDPEVATWCGADRVAEPPPDIWAAWCSENAASR